MGTDAKVISTVPAVTLGWLLEPESPAVAVLTRRTLLGEPDSRETTGLSARRNDYAPVKGILDAIREDGSWDALVRHRLPVVLHRPDPVRPGVGRVPARG